MFCQQPGKRLFSYLLGLSVLRDALWWELIMNWERDSCCVTFSTPRRLSSSCCGGSTTYARRRFEI